MVPNVREFPEGEAMFSVTEKKKEKKKGIFGAMSSESFYKRWLT